MRLSDIRDEQALDTLADLIEPVADILTDEAVKDKFKNEPKIKLVAYICKKHKKSVIEILARLDGEEPDNYSFSLLDLPKKVLEVLNDPQLADLFTSQADESE